MYLEHWGLQDFPFSNVPDSRFFYRSPSHRESLTRLTYLCMHQHGAAILVGPFGSGKTLLGFALLNTINQEDTYRSAFIRNPRLNPLELLQLIAEDLGAPTVPGNKGEALKSIEKCLLSNILDGRHTIIVIDEAHSIEREETFEEVRLLMNLQLEDAHLLTLILMGQPGIEAKIDQRKPLAQRITLVSRLMALTLNETDAYIRYRLQVVGRRERIFDPKSVGAIYRISGGLPRRINHLCDGSLLEGLLARAKGVNPEIVLRAARNLRLSTSASRLPGQRPAPVSAQSPGGRTLADLQRRR